MFSGLLRLELRRTMPADIAGLHQLAARWLAERGQAADAIGHLQAAGDWDEAARMLNDHALSLTLDGQAGTVVALLRSFPARAGADSPDLTLVRAIADQNQLRLDQTDAHLREVRAYAAIMPPATRHRLQMAIASVDLLSARLRGHFDGIFEQAGALLRPGDGQTNADTALGSDLKAVALLNLGVTEAWSLRLADSERHLVEGAALARRIGRHYLEVACLAHLGFASTSHSFVVARQRCEEAIALAARHGWDAEPVTAPALAALANALIWTGQFDLAEHWLDRAKRATQADGEPGVRLLVCFTFAILQAARGHWHRALEEFAAAGRIQALMVGEHGLTTRVNAWTIATQARVISLDYRLASEHPYPAAVDDALAAYDALLQEGTAPSDIAFAGDSAGGGLAVATLVNARYHGLPLPAVAFVMSPYADLTMTGATMDTKERRRRPAQPRTAPAPGRRLHGRAGPRPQPHQPGIR